MNNTRGIMLAIQAYVKHLADDSPVVSTSHLTLRSCYAIYGEFDIDRLLAKYWKIKYRK